MGIVDAIASHFSHKEGHGTFSIFRSRRLGHHQLSDLKNLHRGLPFFCLGQENSGFSMDFFDLGGRRHFDLAVKPRVSSQDMRSGEFSEPDMGGWQEWETERLNGT